MPNYLITYRLQSGQGTDAPSQTAFKEMPKKSGAEIAKLMKEFRGSRKELRVSIILIEELEAD